MKEIPIHDFTRDDATSISFQHIPLDQKNSYDDSVPHRHNYYEIFLFDKGGGQHDIDFQTISIQDSSVHFLSPGQVHNLRRSPDSQGEVILFSREFYSMNMKNSNILNELPLLNNNSSHPVLNLPVEQYNILKGLATTMKNEQNSKDLLKEDLIRSFLNAFLIYAKRFFKSGNHDQKAWIEDTLAFRFKQLVEKHFASCHSLQDYAKMLNITEKQLNSQVKAQTGNSPKDLIFDRIILEAKRLVLFSDHSLQEIAFFLNFTDASHFTKFFKNRTEMLPGAFRKKGEIYKN